MTHRHVDGSWTVVALKAECKSRGMVGYSRLLKAGLIRALNDDGGSSGAGMGAGAGGESPKEKGEPRAATYVAVCITADQPCNTLGPQRPYAVCFFLCIPMPLPAKKILPQSRG